MSFDVTLVHAAGWSRVDVKGDPRLGRLLSLLQVLEIDSASWTREAVLVDLREAKLDLSRDEQAQLGMETARALRRMKKIALLAPPGRLRDAAVIRVFEDEAAALQWLREL